MELDDAYDNLGYIPDALAFEPRWTAAAAAFREGLRQRAVIEQSYGPSPRQTYDLFLPEVPAKGVCIFVHGGYWRRFDSSIWSHLASGPLGQGWAVAMPSYDLCPQVRISAITRQVASAIESIAAACEGPIALAGHSAGGHLAARMLAPGLLSGSTAKRLSRVVPISPLADLRPLLKTSMNADFRLTAQEAEAESPVLITDRLDVPVTVWVGEDERPGFLDQALWLTKGWSCPLRTAPGKHHLDVIDALADPNSRMVSDLLF